MRTTIKDYTETLQAETNSTMNDKNEKELDLHPANIMFSQAIRAAQTGLGSSKRISKMIEQGNWRALLSSEQKAFIVKRDSFYFGTATKQGAPYIQHRGGEPGFIQVEGRSTIWFPDYSGNQHYMSVGNLSENAKSFLFFMDYENQRRIKIWGRSFVHDSSELPTKLKIGPPIQRAICFKIDALDENCRQYIRPRYTKEDYQQQINAANQKIGALQAELQMSKELMSCLLQP